jgi:hypothetical protein
MSPQKTIVCLVVAAIGLMLSGCGKTYSYKYKITVSVSDNGKIKNASGVVGVKATASRKAALPPRICGEAVPIRLSNGKYLLALLNGLPRDPVPGQFQWRDAPTGVLLHRLGLETEWSWKDDTGIIRLPETKGVVELHSHELPEFALIDDTSNPMTMKQIAPDQPEIALGDGVQFRGATLQVTDEDMTRGRIAEVLPWLNVWREYLPALQPGKSVRAYKSVQFKSCVWF